VGDLQIVLSAELEVALEPRRAVLGPLPFEAMRQQENQAASAQPLGLARRDKLIDDDLRAVGEIAELRLPQHEAFRVGERVTILETENPELRKGTIANLETATLDGGKRDIFVAALLIDPNRMALTESAAPAVLA